MTGDPYRSVVDYDREEARSARMLSTEATRKISGIAYPEDDLPDPQDMD